MAIGQEEMVGYPFFPRLGLPAMSTFAFDELTATVLVALAVTQSDENKFLNRKQAGLYDLEKGQAALSKLERAGLVASKKLGLRETGWRLTDAGAARIEEAQALLGEALQARQEAWNRENQVYGAAWLNDDSELTVRQQRAWLNGHIKALLETMPNVPEGAPRAVRDNWESVRRWMIRRNEPYNPHAG